jgi:hypothetical protein
MFVLLHLFTTVVWFSLKAEAWWSAASEIVLSAQRRHIPIGLICRRKDEVVGLCENPMLGGLHVRLVLEVMDEGPQKSKPIRFC